MLDARNKRFQVKSRIAGCVFLNAGCLCYNSYTYFLCCDGCEYLIACCVLQVESVSEVALRVLDLLLELERRYSGKSIGTSSTLSYIISMS